MEFTDDVKKEIRTRLGVVFDALRKEGQGFVLFQEMAIIDALVGK